jgi:hypothetical protein
MAYCPVKNPRVLPLIRSVRGACVAATSDVEDAYLLRRYCLARSTALFRTGQASRCIRSGLSAVPPICAPSLSKTL